MKALSIRVAQEEDLPTLCKMFKQGAEYHAAKAPYWFQIPSDDWIRDFVRGFLLNSKVTFLVALVGSEIAGSIRAELKQSPSMDLFRPISFFHIDEVVVEERFRQQGVAKALITEIEMRAKKLGVSEITLNVWQFNDPARCLYAGLGYAPERTVMKQDI